MYELRKEFRFEAAHVLPKHTGKCARMHGHSWRATVVLRGHGLNAGGMLVDFGDIKDVVQPIVDSRLDHYLLNESTGLADPTSENLARWLFEQIEAALSWPLVGTLYEVRVDETCTSACTYRPDR